MSSTSSQSLQANGLRTRVGGSAFTVLQWKGSVIGFAQQMATVSPTPVGAGATPIQPIDTPYAIEIITPAAQTIGTITLQGIEVYNQKVWEQFAGLQGAPDLVNVFIRMASFGAGGVQVAKIIRPPLLQGVSPVNPLSASDLASIAQGTPQYGEVYQGCVVTNIQDGETVDVGTMAINKQITLAYTYISIFGPNSSNYTNTALALAQRSVPAPS